jgi:peptidoglycan/xylan/chitin deacetylase (PgdA/CDA1 family)
MLLKIAKRFYPGAVWNYPAETEKIFLTFDDGPVPEATPRVLKILDEFKVKATFFCVGENVKKNHGIFNEIVSQKHATGNHTFNHLNGWRTKNSSYFDNVEQCAQVLGASAYPGKNNSKPLFRPPYGLMKKSQHAELNKSYSIIMWDVLAKDYDRKISKQQCLHRAASRTVPGSIILFHDSIKAKENLFYALPRFIEYALKKGFLFAPIPS